jgi:hypothetical protein
MNMADNNINNIANIGAALTKGLQDVTPGKSTAAANRNAAVKETAAAADEVIISGQAQMLSKALAELNTLPDTRQDLVNNAVQAKVIEGKTVPAELLAEKLLMEG